MENINDVKFWVRTLLIALVIYAVFGPTGVMIYAGVKVLRMLK